MKKQLITQDNLESFCQDGKLYLTPEMLLTPAARDKASDLKISLVRGHPQADKTERIKQREIVDPTSTSVATASGHDFIMPTLSIMGFGCLERAVSRCKAMDCKKALIVTDRILREVGLVATVTAQFEAQGVETVVYDGTCPNPTTANVNDGLSLLKQNYCDLVVSLGGGSPHDCAKAIALLATNGGDISDYEGIDKSRKQALPLVAINTTAGTASEMTRFCIITNEQTHVKMSIVDHNVTPVMAVNDPELMLGMPAGLTAATGMDALTHAIEAYLSTETTPLTDAVAGKAIELIVEYLPKAYKDGSDKEAREQMAYAQFMAGMAFNSAGLGYVHAMAHQLGGKYGLPHGICNAVLLPHVMAFNLKVHADRMSDIAYFMGCKLHGKRRRVSSVLAIEEVCQLLLDLNITQGLEELGVKKEDIPEMAANALKDACALTNPRKGSQADIEQIFLNAM